MKAPSGRRLLLPALLLVLGLGLRLDGLATNSFEQDELYTLEESRDLFETRLKPGIEARPLYYLIQHRLLEVLPDTEAGLRALPFAFGVAGLLAIWGLTSSVFGPTAAVLVLGLTVISPWQLYASGMARYWSLVFLLSTIATWLVLLGVDTGRRRYLAGGALAILLGVLTHPTFLFPMLGAALALRLLPVEPGSPRLLPPRRELLWLWAPVIVGIAAITIGLRVTGNAGALQNWAGRGLPASLRLLPGMVEWMTPTMFAAGGLGALACAFWGPGKLRRWGAVAFGAMLAGSGLLFVASFRTAVYPDYGISMLPFFLVSAGGGLAVVAERSRKRATLVALGGGLVLAAGILPSTVSHLIGGSRFDPRPAFRVIERVDPGRMTLTWPIVLQRRYAPHLRASEFLPDAGRLDSILAVEGELWVIASYKRLGLTPDAGGQASRWLDANCHPAGSWSAPRLDFREYRTVLLDCRRHGPGTVARPPQGELPPVVLLPRPEDKSFIRSRLTRAPDLLWSPT